MAKTKNASEKQKPVYILVSVKGQSRHGSHEEAVATYNALEDKRGAYIKRLK